jgi:hypothetical protein
MYPLTILGVALLVTGIKFAREPDAQALALIRALTMTVVFSSIVGTVVGLATTAKFVVNTPEATKDPLPYLLQGFAESVSNAIYGGSFCIVTWMLVAVGVRRMPKDT